MDINVNGERTAVPPEWREDSLLQVLREPLGLVGARFGCGVGQCGACTVLLDGQPVRACALPVAAVGPRAVTTVEGLARDGVLHAVQQAWLDTAVAQCGYCQSGQIIAAVALLRRKPAATAADADAALADHLCRCGTQARARAAVLAAAGALAASGSRA
jgi:isoquinoline 1-oxidoreductase subunit alpha